MADDHEARSKGCPPAGFSKGVHEYLGHYVDVADAKISVLMAVSLAVLGFLLSKDVGCSAALLKWAGVIAEGVAIGAGVFAIYPRLTSGGTSKIFWEDVYARQTPLRYLQELEEMDDATVEREYAVQNYYLSQILHRKFASIRISIIAFIAGATIAGIVIALT